MPTISPILRITVGLLLLTVSLLLIGDLLGIVPNQKQSEIDARKVMAESLAIQVSSQIGENQMSQVADMLNNIVKRNEQIQSIGLRTNAKKIITQSDKHQELWASREDDRSSTTQLQVPIYAKQARWGTLEVSFVPLDTIWQDVFKGRSLPATLLFILIIGSLTYWLFLRRVLSELDPSSVIPDRVRSALDILTEGLVILDINERIILVNTAFKNKLGYSDSELIGKHLSSLPWEMESDELSFGHEKLPWNLLLENDELTTLNTLKLKTATQGTFTFDINVAAIKEPNKKTKGVIVTIDDITELEKKNNELNHILDRLEKSQNEISRQNKKLFELATQDPLTHLLNRRSLFEGMNTLLLEAEYQDTVLSCIIVDIDFFKSVNDNLGHVAGDKVLKVITEILQTMVRPNDLVGRYGGEEFVVVFPGLDESEAIKIAEKIRKRIFEQQFDEFSTSLTVTASFGVTSTQEDIWHADKLIDQADQALYIAKQSGRNQVVSYSQINVNSVEVKINPTTTLKKNTIEKMSRSLHASENIEKNPVKHANTFEMREESFRTVILDRLAQSCKLAQRNRTNLAVLTIFIDTIEMTNNTLGYASAEKLKKVAFERLTETFRLSDSVIPEVNSRQSISLSRTADSEFTAILVGINHAEDTTWAIFRMFKELALPVDIDGNEIVMTANIGASIYPADGEHPEALLSNSKMALQKAKEEGRGEVLFYNEDMNSRSKQVLKIESQLHQSLEREELYLNFQPIINIETGQIEKVEALLRWKHPEFGLVPPDIFIQISEHSGNIKMIGRWVIQNACRQLKAWRQSGYKDVIMSINLSSIQFTNISLAEEITEIVIEEGISPESILLELTETALIKQYDVVFSIITELHTKGFKIALDDFGTGYSSLEYLHKFPIDFIKMDCTLMKNFPMDTHAVSIVSGIISLAHNLGIHVINEGVENESQLLMLYNLGCDEVQGYVFSRPLSFKDMGEFFDSTASRRLIRKIKTIQSSVKEEQPNTVLIDILNAPPA